MPELVQIHVRHVSGIREGVTDPRRTHTEEFYEVTECAWMVEALNHELVQWETIYNTVRPHQPLGYLTPLQFLKRLSMIPRNHPLLSQMS